MLESLPHLLDHISPIVAYLILMLSAIVENIFPPIPGDTVTVIGAYFVSTGKLEFWGVYISTTVGSVIGFFIMYLLGLKLGTRLLNARWTKKTFSQQKIKKVEYWFSRYGYWVVVANRFLSGTRSVVSIFAGFFGLRWPLVLLYSFISATIWNGLLIYGGYLVGVNWNKITVILKQYNQVVLIVTIAAIALFLIYRFIIKKEKVS
ncbi:hypothetical protein DRI50_07095 [candidate division KSB1 bacterium]|nr:MAG: hypothetical protein DRI50_07095 [candidate division KSB1 bacterium]